MLDEKEVSLKEKTNRSCVFILQNLISQICIKSEEFRNQCRLNYIQHLSKEINLWIECHNTTTVIIWTCIDENIDATIKKYFSSIFLSYKIM